MRIFAAWIVGLSLLASQAHAQTRPQSDNYRLPTDVQAVGGGEAAKSNNYLLDDTIGEANIGESRSGNYQLDAGYRQTLETYLAFGCDDAADMGTIVFTGQAEVSANCTVTTDADAGYALKWSNVTGSGGTMTGYLISPDEESIASFAYSHDGLIGHWRLDETSGTNAVDSSGYGNDGTLTNGPVISADIPSNVNFADIRSVDFDGTDDLITQGDIDEMDGLTAVTVSGWVKWGGTVSDFASERTIARKQNGSVGVFALGGGWDGTREKARFWINDGSWINSGDGTTDIADGEWHHVAGTYDGNAVRVYVDGVEENANVIGATTLSANAASFDVGGYGGGEYWNGLLDEIRVYGRALSAAEIKALYGEPQTWSVPASQSAWGARLSSASDDTDSKWGIDSSSEKWLNVGDGNYTVVTRPSRTDVSGSDQILRFRSEVGAAKIQPSGVYRSTVTLTAVSL